VGGGSIEAAFGKVQLVADCLSGRRVTGGGKVGDKGLVAVSAPSAREIDLDDAKSGRTALPLAAM